MNEKMELNKITTFYGQCRCCLVTGNHHDLLKEYYCDGDSKVYSDMFIDCFNLFLCTDVRLSSLICSICVQQLKVAACFKLRVLDSERHLLKLVNSHNGKEIVYVNESQEALKEEILFKGELVDDCDLSFHESEGIHEGFEEQEDSTIREKEFISRFPLGTLRKLPTRSTLDTICSSYVVQLEKLKGKLITARKIERLLATTDTKRELPVSDKMAHVTNIATFLQYSNLAAFKTKYRNGFPCFYCGVLFNNFQTLRLHQEVHKKEDIMKLVLKKYQPGRQDSLVVYADVTDLKCTLCDRSLASLTELKSHLTNVHERSMYKQYTDRVIPFKMVGASYECQICCFNFETFGAIERHMNTHYRNYVCEKCGAGFITRNRLKIHTYSLHTGLGKFPCDVCNKCYPTRNKLKIHFDTVHRMSRKVKCPQCPAKFAYYAVRQKHLVDVHGQTPVLYKCNVCEKSFRRSYHLKVHIKKNHLDEKGCYCKFCAYNCFSNHELQVHLFKQHGEKFFECTVCKKCYASQKSLAQHMKVH